MASTQSNSMAKSHSKTSEERVAGRIVFDRADQAGDSSAALCSIVTPVKVTARIESKSTAELSSSADPGFEFVLTKSVSPDSERWLSESSAEVYRLRLDDGLTIRWQSRRAVIVSQSTDPNSAEIKPLLVAFAQFAIYEQELNRLETALAPIESHAPADVALCFEIKSQQQSQWPRLRKIMQELAMMRLDFARLEPCFWIRVTGEPRSARALRGKLARAIDAEARLEAFTDRLEACEDLYEGAVDRITDHRWYRRTDLMEMAIVALLIIEIIAIAGEMVMQHLQH